MIQNEAQVGLKEVHTDNPYRPIGQYQELEEPADLSQFGPSVQYLLRQLIYTGRQIGLTDIGEQNPVFYPAALAQIVDLRTFQAVSKSLLRDFENRERHRNLLRRAHSLDPVRPKVKLTIDNRIVHASLIRPLGEGMGPNGAFSFIISGRHKGLFGSRPTLMVTYHPQTSHGTREQVRFDLVPTNSSLRFSSSVQFSYGPGGEKRLQFSAVNTHAAEPEWAYTGIFNNQGERIY